MTPDEFAAERRNVLLASLVTHHREARFQESISRKVLLAELKKPHSEAAINDAIEELSY